jgi:hypothetical protein
LYFLNSSYIYFLYIVNNNNLYIINNNNLYFVNHDNYNIYIFLRAAAPAADPGSKYGGLATFGYLLKQGNSLYQLKKHTQLHPASRRFRGAIFEEAGPLGIGILLVQQVAKCS